jgi:hypothetical protein
VPGIRKRLPQDDVALLDDTLARARALLEAGRYVDSWQCLASGEVQVILTKKLRTLEYIRPWLIIGPFPNNKGLLKKEEEAASAGRYCSWTHRLQTAEAAQ